MGSLEEYVHNLIIAINTGNKREEERILSDLRKLGMDKKTAYMAAYAVSQEESE